MLSSGGALQTWVHIGRYPVLVVMPQVRRGNEVLLIRSLYSEVQLSFLSPLMIGKGCLGCSCTLRGEMRTETKSRKPLCKSCGFLYGPPWFLSSLVILPFRIQKLHSCLQPSPGPFFGWKWGASQEEMKGDRCSLAFRFSNVNHWLDSFGNRKMGLKTWCKCKHLKSLLENTQKWLRVFQNYLGGVFGWEVCCWSENQTTWVFWPSVFQRASTKGSDFTLQRNNSVINKKWELFPVSKLFFQFFWCHQRESQFWASVSLVPLHHMLMSLFQRAGLRRRGSNRQ